MDHSNPGSVDSHSASEESYVTFLCRAQYDYKASDPSSLSFRKGDIIEVITQLESGWWDGLLHDDRGWFPSNYVALIEPEEAESSLNLSDSDLIASYSQPDREWTDEEIDLPSGRRVSGRGRLLRLKAQHTQHSDFWVPQVTHDGQIFYVNTQTGERSRDLPTDADDEASDGDFTGLTSQSSSRSGTSASLGLGTSDSERSDPDSLRSDLSDSLGPLILGRNGTPEPWTRMLADDGQSHYYYNNMDGQIKWTLPEQDVTTIRNKPTSPKNFRFTPSKHNFNRDTRDTLMPPNRIRTASSPRIPGPRSPKVPVRPLSVYSDDSGVLPEQDSAELASGQTGSYDQASLALPTLDTPNTLGSPSRSSGFSAEKISEERYAELLQIALTPLAPRPLSDLAANVFNSISAVLDDARSGAFPRSPNDTSIDDLVCAVVDAVRSLVYVSAATTGRIPSQVITQDSSEIAGSPIRLKAARLKVTAVLSKLVLSARAIQYVSGLATNTPERIEEDAMALQRSVTTFVNELRKGHDAAEEASSRRLHGTFSITQIAPGLLGSGAGGSWKGFGWVALSGDMEPPQNIIGPEIVAETKVHISRLKEMLNVLALVLRNPINDSADRVWIMGTELVTTLSSLLDSLADINIAGHVDVDGIRPDQTAAKNGAYMDTVKQARLLVRTLECATQSLYDDTTELLISTQSTRLSEPSESRKVLEQHFDCVDKVRNTLSANLNTLEPTLEALVSLGWRQVDIAPADHSTSTERRLSLTDPAHSQIGDLIPNPMGVESHGDDESVIGFEMAFSTPITKLQNQSPMNAPYQHIRQPSGVTSTLMDQFVPGASDVPALTVPTSFSVQASKPLEPSLSDLSTIALQNESREPFEDEELLTPNGADDPAPSSSSLYTSPSRGATNKLAKILGEEPPKPYTEMANAYLKPWYLRPSYSPGEIIIEPEGVRGGTVAALVERLTAHEVGDTTFIKTFLMTFKSFTTLDELFEMLVKRFWIKPPENLTPSEHDEWVKQKQHLIQMRVINAFKSMVLDDDVLEKEDMYILNRIKSFAAEQEVIRFAAAKQLMVSIERVQKGIKMRVNTGRQAAPMSIIPKASKKLKLLDIDTLELARQLTLMESQMYQKIRPMECLVRSREQKTEFSDNISAISKISNQISDWVAESILSKEDPRRRSAVIKHFISVAYRCRALHNYSTMAGIISGLGSSPINRLKRSWELVQSKYMAQLSACETTMDSSKNFSNYRTTLATVSPPCVPYIGVFLTTLQFIQDGQKDDLPGNLVNFRKRQKAAEVVQDIKRWQSQPYNFHAIPSVLTFIDESLQRFNDVIDIRDLLWNLSLEREPREREDEKVARLLQETGFL